MIVAVRIAGHDYKVRSDGDPDGLREIAGYVDRAMARVRERTGTVDTFDVAVLTCLNLAREILTLRQARTPEGSTAIEDDKLKSLIEQVEAVLRVKPAVDEAPPSGDEGDAGVVTTLELEHRVTGFEVVPAHEPGGLELGQDPVNGREPHIIARL